MKAKYYIPLLVFLSQVMLFSQTTYIWTGSVNSNFSTAGNWSPIRQISRTNDRLVFNNGLNNIITGVNQITFTQLVLTGNTSVVLSPGSGNARIIFIEAFAGDSQNGTSGENNNKTDLASLKYKEYTTPDTVKDLATLKYNEYSSGNDIQKNDLASQKYNEYKNPPVSGMGDIKKNENELDNPADNNIYIESGSSLRINANDPSLSIYLKANATAEIYGTLILEGTLQNSINSQDPFSINFMAGSKLIQKCPGNIFNTNGANNSAVFQSGSVLDIASSSALSPFALDLPYSKVVFENNSKVLMNSPSSNALRLSGRTYPDIEINCNLTINEIIVNDCNINKLQIDPNASLTVNNLNNSSQIPSMNIKGDLIINGNLNFPESPVKKLNIKFNGNIPQNISGTGLTDVNSSIDNIYISNDLIINRDLAVSCNVIHNNGTITCTEHTFTVNGSYISPFAVPIGIIVQNQKFASGISPDKDSKDKYMQTDNEKLSVIEASAKNIILPTEYSLSQNYPNPFNPSTTIEFAMPEESNVILKVYDISGKEVKTLVNGIYKAGINRIKFDASNFSSGVYIYKILFQNSTEYVSKVNKMILTK